MLKFSAKKQFLLLPIIALTGCLSPTPNPKEFHNTDQKELDDAIEIYQRAKLEDLLLTSDPLELGEQLTFSAIEKLAEQNRFKDIFNIGDELFEKELDERFGKGVGASHPDAVKPTRLLSNIGGMDSGSCRSCHFKGGPDGSGTATSIAMMRSDGQNISSATLRDAPHVMGLGYIQRVADEMTKELQSIALLTRSLAMQLKESLTRDLSTQGIHFGSVTALEDGTFDMALVKHVQNDLVVRPFGHKGRARNLVEFIDEALQMHHGIQTHSRISKGKPNPQLLGTGPHYDPDNDGKAFEASSSLAIVMAAYLSMLPIPTMQPPVDSKLAMAWGQGRLLFDQLGCAACHVPELRFIDDKVAHANPINSKQVIEIALLEYAEEPAARKLDFGANSDGYVLQGTPIYAFTDLRLHDLGPEMADDSPEPSVDGKTSIEASKWLTRSLWGLADTAPYLHDGRATNLNDAILWHGGDANDSRENYKNLSEAQQASLMVFLSSLSREPTVLVE